MINNRYVFTHKALFCIGFACFLLNSHVSTAMHIKSEKFLFEKLNKTFDNMLTSLKYRKQLLRELYRIKLKLKTSVITGSYYFTATFLCDTTMEMMTMSAGGLPDDLTACTPDAMGELHDDANTLISYATSLYSLIHAWYNVRSKLSGNEYEIHNLGHELITIKNLLLTASIDKASIQHAIAESKNKFYQLALSPIDNHIINNIQQLFDQLEGMT